MTIEDQAVALLRSCSVTVFDQAGTVIARGNGRDAQLPKGPARIDAMFRITVTGTAPPARYVVTSPTGAQVATGTCSRPAGWDPKSPTTLSIRFDLT